MDQEKLFFLFRQISEQFENYLTTNSGLNWSQIRLVLSFEENETLKMSDIAKKLNLSVSTVSRQLDQKGTKQLINIKTMSDNRLKVVELSSEGLQKQSELNDEVKKLSKTLFSYWDEQEIATLNTLTSLLQKRLAKIDETN